MTTIPTAEEYLSDNINRTAFPHIDENIADKDEKSNTILKCMKQFAKLHVIEALKEANKRAEKEFVFNEAKYYKKLEDSILNAYPLTKIV